MISKNTCYKIWNCYNEIEKAEKLIEDLKVQVSKSGDMLIEDKWGDRRGLNLGVPTSDSGNRLFNVPPDLCLQIIERHIENQNIKLSELATIAAIELKY